MKDKFKENYFNYISYLIIIGAFIVVCMIASLSELGMHPDEYDVKACLDWAKSHFIWPDMRLKGEGLGDTYSGYGYTKVCNYTPYFLIASKIALVFEQFLNKIPYYRVPNFLLMLFLTVYMLRNVKRHSYLMLGFGICAQAWYIFSYVTADALDFTLAFISIALLADGESFLWRALSDETKGYARCVPLGILYGIMLLGKPYYYATMALAFIVLVLHLIKTEFNNRKLLFRKYLVIIGISFGILLARFGLDIYYYGFDKAAASEQMAEEYADYDKNPLTPVSEQDVTWRMASKGYPISALFKEDLRWFIKSFRSFVSARVLSDGDTWYFVIMGALYAVIYVYMGIEAYTSRELAIFTIGTLLNIGGIIASVLNSYINDNQPQGRYLLPITLTVCYMSCRLRGLWERRGFKMAVLAAGCLSIMYFGLFDSRKLIDLAYVRQIWYTSP